MWRWSLVKNGRLLPGLSCQIENNYKTIIEIGYRKISWFVSAALCICHVYVASEIHLYIAFCSGLGHQHSKSVNRSRYQSVYELTEISQAMMSDDVISVRRQATTPGTTFLTLFEQCVGSLTSYRVISEQSLWEGTSGLIICTLVFIEGVTMVPQIHSSNYGARKNSHMQEANTTYYRKPWQKKRKRGRNKLLVADSQTV